VCPPTSVARTAVRFLLTLVGVMALWLVFLEPGYDRFIAHVGVWALRAIESPRMTESVRMADTETLVSRTAEYSDLKEQRLDLRTHHNNAPLLIALILATPGLTRARRDRTLVVAMSVLAVTHVLHFMLTVHWVYAIENVGPYRVTDLKYLHLTFWQSLDNPAQTAKIVVACVEEFYTHVGRLLMPILLWMILCRDALAAHARHRP
jgi:hypothetical protein